MTQMEGLAKIVEPLRSADYKLPKPKMPVFNVTYDYEKGATIRILQKKFVNVKAIAMRSNPLGLSPLRNQNNWSLIYRNAFHHVDRMMISQMHRADIISRMGQGFLSSVELAGRGLPTV